MIRRQSNRNQHAYNIIEDRERVLGEIMNKLVGGNKCYDNIRMGPRVFIELCEILVKKKWPSCDTTCTCKKTSCKIFLYT